ncbi:uncharacterized protein [Nicotiana tomentosiformis]|uniref:uncharacterized protein n=1 Tax=Nicotiana tomentosiformis TaxID=4098 RepID=UPI00051C928B|nr:uncharacterized protein LOC104117089 [Nicotiana tomentosiformis]
MSSTSRAWITATSLGVVEALKDQGICRWNYALRTIHQHANNNVRSYSQAKKLSSHSSSLVSANNLKQSESSLRKVMYLSCWGPNSILIAVKFSVIFLYIVFDHIERPNDEWLNE